MEESLPTTIELKVEEEGVRIDRYVSRQLPQFTRSYVQKLIDDGCVLVQGRQVRPSFKPRPGDVIAISPLAIVPSELLPLHVSLDIIYEDEDLLVINKPAGMTVHPAPGHPADTLVNAVLAHCPSMTGIKGTMRPGVVHRLDKETSGVIVCAKNDKALADLQQQFKGRKVQKAYLVLVQGKVSPRSGTIEGPIGRDPAHRQRMAIVAGGREARTSYRVLEYPGGYTLLEVRPETGRTHQIRVHFAAAGYPVAGDSVYGSSNPIFPRQFLHASALALRLPATGEFREFKADTPEDLNEALGRIRFVAARGKGL